MFFGCLADLCPCPFGSEGTVLPSIVRLWRSLSIKYETQCSRLSALLSAASSKSPNTHRQYEPHSHSSSKRSNCAHLLFRSDSIRNRAKKNKDCLIFKLIFIYVLCAVFKCASVFDEGKQEHSCLKLRSSLVRIKRI